MYGSTLKDLSIAGSPVENASGVGSVYDEIYGIVSQTTAIAASARARARVLTAAAATTVTSQTPGASSSPRYRGDMRVLPIINPPRYAGEFSDSIAAWTSVLEKDKRAPFSSVVAKIQKIAGREHPAHSSTRFGFIEDTDAVFLREGDSEGATDLASARLTSDEDVCLRGWCVIMGDTSGEVTTSRIDADAYERDVAKAGGVPSACYQFSGYSKFKLSGSGEGMKRVGGRVMAPFRHVDTGEVRLVSVDASRPWTGLLSFQDAQFDKREFLKRPTASSASSGNVLVWLSDSCSATDWWIPSFEEIAAARFPLGLSSVQELRRASGYPLGAPPYDSMASYLRVRDVVESFEQEDEGEGEKNTSHHITSKLGIRRDYGEAFLGWYIDSLLQSGDDRATAEAAPNEQAGGFAREDDASSRPGGCDTVLNAMSGGSSVQHLLNASFLPSSAAGADGTESGDIRQGHMALAKPVTVFRADAIRQRLPEQGYFYDHILHVSESCMRGAMPMSLRKRMVDRMALRRAAAITRVPRDSIPRCVLRAKSWAIASTASRATHVGRYDDVLLLCGYQRIETASFSSSDDAIDESAVFVLGLQDMPFYSPIAPTTGQGGLPAQQRPDAASLLLAGVDSSAPIDIARRIVFDACSEKKVASTNTAAGRGCALPAAAELVLLSRIDRYIQPFVAQMDRSIFDIRSKKAQLREKFDGAKSRFRDYAEFEGQLVHTVRTKYLVDIVCGVAAVVVRTLEADEYMEPSMKKAVSSARAVLVSFGIDVDKDKVDGAISSAMSDMGAFVQQLHIAPPDLADGRRRAAAGGRPEMPRALCFNDTNPVSKEVRSSISKHPVSDDGMACCEQSITDQGIELSHIVDVRQRTSRTDTALHEEARILYEASTYIGPGGARTGRPGADGSGFLGVRISQSSPKMVDDGGAHSRKLESASSSSAAPRPLREVIVDYLSMCKGVRSSKTSLHKTLSDMVVGTDDVDELWVKDIESKAIERGDRAASMPELVSSISRVFSEAAGVGEDDGGEVDGDTAALLHTLRGTCRDIAVFCLKLSRNEKVDLNKQNVGKLLAASTSGFRDTCHDYYVMLSKIRDSGFSAVQLVQLFQAAILMLADDFNEAMHTGSSEWTGITGVMDQLFARIDRRLFFNRDVMDEADESRINAEREEIKRRKISALESIGAENREYIQAYREARSIGSSASEWDLIRQFSNANDDDRVVESDRVQELNMLSTVAERFEEGEQDAKDMYWSVDQDGDTDGLVDVHDA